MRIRSVACDAVCLVEPSVCLHQVVCLNPRPPLQRVYILHHQQQRYSMKHQAVAAAVIYTCSFTAHTIHHCDRQIREQIQFMNLHPWLHKHSSVHEGCSSRPLVRSIHVMLTESTQVFYATYLCRWGKKNQVWHFTKD